ncbi:Transcriptional regulatory protein RcsB [compost metagenome]
MSVTDIGRRFQRSPKTVSVQKCAAMAKLGLKQDIDLARFLATTDWGAHQRDTAVPLALE